MPPAASIAEGLRPWSTLLAMRRDPLRFLERMAARHGDLAPLRVGPYKLLFINHPDLLHEVFVAKDASFHKGRALDQTRDVFGQGLLTSEGDFHRRQRRLIQPAFHRRRIEAYADAMAADAAATAARWQDGQTVDIQREMMRLTLRIVARCLFSVDVEDESAREVGQALDALIGAFRIPPSPLRALFQKLPPAHVPPSERRARKALATLDALVYGMIAERRRTGDVGDIEERGDLLSLLLAARDEDDGGAMSDRQARDEALTLFLAGHETTANALAWTWYLLAQNPEAEARFHAEIDEVLGDRLPGARDVPALPYTRQVFTESMRLYPPAWGFSRRAIEPVTVGGHAVEPGTGVLASQWVLHRDPRYFPDPLAFRPERWTEDFEASLPRLAYFPFGAGPRICIGMGFARMEGALLLATLGRRWRMRLVPGQRIRPQARITLRPEGGIRVVLERRAKMLHEAPE